MGLFDSIFGGGGNVSLPNIEDLRPLMQAQADINRPNQVTPFGSYSWNKVGGKSPLSESEWNAQNPAVQQGQSTLNSIFGNNSRRETPQVAPSRGSYQDYLSSFDPGGKNEVRFDFSPEMQSLFDKQFSPDAYQGYADDYMSRYNQLLDPYRQQETDRFQQSMVNRGIPEGSDVYGDYYRPIGDQRSRADLMAAQAAQGTADNRVMQDYNRLITAMGGSAIPFQPVDVMGPANMSLNAQMSNVAGQNQASSNLWNSVAGLGGAMALGGTGIFGP